MAIRFYCPLGHRLHAPASQQGKLVHCPACRQRVIVPLLDLGSREAAGLLTSPASKNSVRQVFSGSIDPKISGDQKISSVSAPAESSPLEKPSQAPVWADILPGPSPWSVSEGLESEQGPLPLSAEPLASGPHAQASPALPENPVLPGPEEPLVELVSLASEEENSADWPAKGDKISCCEEAEALPGPHLHLPPQQPAHPVDQPGCVEDFFLSEQVPKTPPENIFWETVLEEIPTPGSPQAESRSGSSPPPTETSAPPSHPEVPGPGNPADRPTAKPLSDLTEILAGRPRRQPDRAKRRQIEEQESAPTRLVEEARPVAGRTASDVTPARTPASKLASARHGELPWEEPAQTAFPVHASVDRVGEHPGGAPALWPPPKPVDLDPVRSHEVRWLAVWLGLIVLFSIGPAFRHLVLSMAPGWARLVVLVGLWELAYVAWMVLCVHRVALWVVMVVFAAGATLSAVTTAFTLVAANHEMLPAGLDQIRRWAPRWFGCVLAVQTLGAYLAGRWAFLWGEMDRRLARHQRLG